MLRPYQEGVTLVGPGGSWGDLAAGEAVASGLLERAEAIAEGRGGGIDGLSLFNFGDERGADDGGVGEAAKNRNVAGKRDSKTNSDGELRNAAGAADERGEIIGQHIFCAGDAGAGNQIEETGRASGDFREAVVGGSWSAEKDAVEMMHGENAAIVFGFFRREVRDEDAIGAGDCCGGSEFFETHLQDGIVVAEEDERDLSARSVPRWIVGPSASGSLKGTPSSMTSAPASASARTYFNEASREGSPATMYATMPSSP